MISTGDRIGHFEIIDLLGEGGMGQVYLAKDSVLERNVAIKFLPPDMERDPQTKIRFVREAKSAAALDNPFICKVYETGESEGKSFIVMEYVKGKTLDKKMEEETFSIAEKFRIALEISEALDEAHKVGIVHRDLKPANIMITPQNHVKVMDFGLAKRILPKGKEELAATITQSSITEQGVIAGTIAYMSPEQARGEEIDARSDIFSLGIIFQEMISGNHPFSKLSAIETLSSILRDPPPQTQVSPKSANQIIAPILRKALAKDVGSRYQNAAELIADLKKAQREISGGSLPRRRLLIYGAGMLVVAVLVVVMLKFVLPTKTPEPGAGPDPISVLVADFQNETGDPVFDGALEQAINIGLGGASFISIYDRLEAEKIAREVFPDSGGKLDSQTAHRVCAREAISKFIDGSIEKEGSGYKLTVRVRDPVYPDDVKEYSRSVDSRGDVLNAAASLANKVRSDLGDISADPNKAFQEETYTTSSLEAMNEYTKAQELYREGKDEEAIAGYLRAIEKDPEFGRAYAMLAIAYHNRGQYEESETYFQEAFSRIDSMSEREKFRTRALYYVINRNYQEAIKECSEWVEKYPADSIGFSNLALSHFYARNYEQAKEMGQRAVELSPKRIQIRFNLGWYALAASDFAMAVREERSVIKADPNFYEAYVVLALANLAQGEVNEAAKMYEVLDKINPIGKSLAALGLADIALYEGRLSDAADILEKQLELDRKESRTDYLGNKWSLLAQARLLSGKNALAIEAADQAVASGKDLASMFMSALIYIQAGKEAKALSLAEELSEQLESEPKVYAKLIEGEIKKKNGKFHEAIALFQEAQTILDTWIGRCILGKTFIEIEAYQEAHSFLDLCLEHRGEAASVFGDDTPTYHVVAPLYYYVGRAQEGLKSPAAVESYRQFLALKVLADSETPLIKDARQRLSNR